MSKDLQQLREQWSVDLARLLDGYADALEDGTDPVKIAQIEGMIATYRRIIHDARRRAQDGPRSHHGRWGSTV